MTETFPKKRPRDMLFISVAVFLCVSLPSCVDDKEACGKNMTLEVLPIYGRSCVPNAVDTDTGTQDTDLDAGPDAAVSTDNEGSDIPTGLGDPCDGHADCTGEADYCAVPPGVPGCTIQDCNPTANDGCPPGYSCFNLTAIAPSEPAICVPEG